VLIVTNGERTEVDYFRALKDEPWAAGVSVKVVFEAGAPDAVVARAAERGRQGFYEEVWVVCDVDHYDVRDAIAGAETGGIRLALSQPCFEVWLILHHANCTRMLRDAKQAAETLGKKLSAYDKRRLRFQDFRTGLPDAVERAKKLGEPPEANPSTAVWRIVESWRETDADG
jgi:hypothetical protein